MSGKFATRWFWSALTQYDEEQGLLFKKTIKKDNPRFADISDYATKIKEAYETLDSQGYDVINVIPMSMGVIEPSIARSGNYLGDAGFSITRGAVVVGKKRE